MEKYRPLPDYLVVLESGIHGKGLFTTKDIPKGTKIGISHFQYKCDGELHRKAIGDWYNHSDTPNCKKVIDVEENRTVWYLYTIEDIEQNSELTVSYTFYKV